MHRRAQLLTLTAVLCAGGALIARADDVSELAKQNQNPIADLVNIPVQASFTSGGDLKDRSLTLLKLQPIFPLPLTARWNVFLRPIIPVENTPLSGGGRKLGLRDIQPQIYFSPVRTGPLAWGLGPVFSFPTASNDAVRTGQWGVGPAGALNVRLGPWVFGGLVNNVWRIAGTDGKAKINILTIQPMLNFNLAQGWALGLSPQITANWAASHGNQWTVPLGLGISKVQEIGTQRVSLSLHYYRNVVHPDGVGVNQLRMVVGFLFPKAPKPVAAEAPDVARESAR